MTASRTRRGVASASMVIGITLLAIAAFASPASADKPEGNNGTVKIDGEEFDTHPNNQPHVGCIFQVDFYGFDANTAVTMEFKAHPPTGNAIIHTENGVLDDDDNTDGGSEDGLDGQFTIDLTDALEPYEPHDQQGFHVKLTVTADDGDDKGAQSKHKTYWVDGCEEGGDDGDDGGDDTGGVAPTAGATDTNTNTDTEVEGEVIRPAQLPRTGAEDKSLFILGLGFIAIGAVVLVAKKAVFIG